MISVTSLYSTVSRLLLRGLRSGWSSLESRIHKPDLSDAGFIRAVRECVENSSGADNVGHYSNASRRLASSSMLDSACLATEKTAVSPKFRKEVCADALVDYTYEIARYFRNGRVHAFFVHQSEVVELVEQIRRNHPNWYQALKDRIGADFEVGLPIYSRTGPRLGADFPWDDVPPGPGQDSLYSKHPHRFAFAPRSALAAHMHPEGARRFREVLEGWISTARGGRCKYCYDSPLAVIQRVVALSWAWVFLAGRPESADPDGLGLEFMVLKILWADCAYLAPKLGHSFPNNHLLGDAFAIWYLRTVFPELAAAAKITGDPNVAWLREMERQVYPDGSGFEHSGHYHEFALEMGISYILLSKRNGHAVPGWLHERIEAMLRFHSALAGPEANQVDFGDSIEESLIPLDPGNGLGKPSFRMLCRKIFSCRLSAPTSAETEAIRAWWLLAGNCSSDVSDVTVDTPVGCFKDGGFVVMNDPAGDRLIFRTGPAPNSEVMAGHMHADLLSVQLSLKGIPFLVDAGTYSYGGMKTECPEEARLWRRYFAGPLAHNGPYIVDKDPLGPLRGNFRSAATEVRVQTTVTQGTSLVWAEGVILGGGDYHLMRRGILHVVGDYWLICDRPGPACTNGDAVSSGFQFAPGIHVDFSSGEDGKYRISNGATHLDLLASTGVGSGELFKGSMNPLGGWVSPGYGQLEAAPQLRFSYGPATSPLAAFVLASSGSCPTESNLERVLVQMVACDVVMVSIKRDDVEEHVILALGERRRCDVSVLNGIRFVGKLCRVRLRSSRVESLQWLDASRFEWAEEGIEIATHSNLSELKLNGTSVRLDDFATFRWLN